MLSIYLGHGSGRKVSIPQVVEKLKDHRVVRVASYNEHTAALVEPFDESGNFARGYGDSSIPVTPTFLRNMREMVDEEKYR